MSDTARNPRPSGRGGSKGHLFEGHDAELRDRLDPLVHNGEITLNR